MTPTAALRRFISARKSLGSHSVPASAWNLPPIPGLDDGRTVVPVDAYLSERSEGVVPGIYALFDQAEQVQYIGWSRDVISALKARRSRMGPHKAAFVRVQAAGRGAETDMAREAERWIQACPVLPPGNGEERDEWEAVDAARSSVEPGSQSGSYTEEEEVGIRLAMGEDLDDAEFSDIHARHEHDHDADVDLPEGFPMPDGPVTPPPLASPFTRAAVHRQVGGGAPRAAQALTVEAVHAALEDVRPFLLADGGDVRVAGVQGPDVHLEFQGACSTCPSSEATMTMGIERCLRAAFGPALRNIVQVNARAPGATVEAVDAHLGLLRGAVTSLGGTVSVASVEDGECTILFTGPPALKHGVRAAIQEQFPDLHTVTVRDG